ncbi:hypothetical protein BH20VER1_BH20VER1_18740 [soil metagenome]
MKISVVVPSLNQGSFLGTTLESILTQPHSDLEIRVCDGGSSDDTLAVLENYRSRIAFSTGGDRGQADAINQGLKEVTGDIVTYLNSDDVYLPSALRRVAEYFSANDDCQVVYGEAWHVDGGGALLDRYPTEPWNYQRLLEGCYLCQPAVFWRREIHDRFGVFDETLTYALDYDYWLRVGREVRFHYLPGVYLAGSRLHAECKTLKHRVAAHHEILEVALRHSSDPPLPCLLNVASVMVEAQRQESEGEIGDRRWRALLVQAALQLADQHKIPLNAEFLNYLESLLRVRRP